MKSIFLSVIILFFVVRMYAQTTVKDISEAIINIRLQACVASWKYFKLDHQIRGKVLSYSKGICGYFMISSNTIILTSTRDTVRVLELPCEGNVLVKSDSVLIIPVNKVDTLGLRADGKFDCNIKSTCYAKIIKIH